MIIRSLVEVGDRVLSVFSEKSDAINIDQCLILKRRGLSICSVSTEELLEKFSVE